MAYVPDYAGPAYNYAPSGPPPGVSSNPFDQSSVNWNMAQKYGAERAQQNRDITDSAALAYNNWVLNGQRGAAPNAPALFETDPTKLYSFFNSNQVGIPIQGGGLLNYNTATTDPLQAMLRGGSGPLVPPGGPASPGAPPPAQQPSTPYVPSEQAAPAQPQSGGIPAGARPANMWNDTVAPPPGGIPAGARPANQWGGTVVPAASPAAPVAPAATATAPAAGTIPSSGASAGRGGTPEYGRPNPSEAVQAMQAPQPAAARTQNFARGSGLPSPRAYNPVAQGGVPPPAPPSAPPNSYNALQVPRYGRQYRPTGAMSGSYAASPYTTGQMRRY